MKLNSSSLNSAAINASSGGVLIVASGSLISFEQSIESIQAGQLISISQNVGKMGLGSLIYIEQITQVRVVAYGSLISFEQQVSSLLSGNIINFEQRTVDSAVDRVTRAGWDATFTLDGRIVDNTTIVGQINIQRAETQASLMDITLYTTPGVQTIEFLQGKRVTLDVHTADGTFRLYTGVVDIPEIDLIRKTITLKCTDKRTEQINSQLGNVVKTIGYFSPLIFQDIKDTADELDKRLSTTPFSVDFDSFGNYTLTSLLPKATADFVLDSSEVYYRDPSVRLASRGRIVNKVNIDFQYRYERLHHVKRSFEWESTVAESAINFLRYNLSMTFRSMVQGAIDAAGWPIQGEINYTPIWPSGYYGGIGWSTVRFSRTTVPLLDEDGDQVYDTEGKPVYSSDFIGGTQYADLYCMGAIWDATTRFAQTITESTSLSVSASQSIAQFGTIEQAESYSTEDTFDTSIWEKYEAYTDLGLGTGNYAINQDANRAGMNQAMVTVLNKARTTILNSHRDTRVSFSKFLWPQIDLKHTVELATNTIETKGKVVSINHSLDISTTEAVTTVQLALFKATGSAVDSSLVAPAKPTDTNDYGTGTITLGNHFGEDPNQDGAELWTGFIGNKIPFNSLFRTTYTEQFIVDTPAIPDSVRNAKELTGSASYNVSIPDDDLIITF